MNMKFTKKLAFTLAETLIVMGIIGVVAALTMPSLVQNHQKTLYATQLRKVYSDISQAILQVKTDSKAVKLSESSFVRNSTLTFLQNYFNITKSCSGTTSGCLASSYKNMVAAPETNLNSKTRNCVVLNGGATICIITGNADYYFLVDVNGPKNPNAGGLDLHAFKYSTASDTMDYTVGNCGSNMTYTGVGLYKCTNKLIDNGWKID